MRFRDFNAPLLVGCLVAASSTGGCEKAAPIVSCDTVVEALYAEGLAAADEDGAALDQPGATALCHELELTDGCGPEFERWFGCLEGAIAGDTGDPGDPGDTGDASPVCPREVRAVAACREGDTYEYTCDDADDGDGDGDTDCADEDCADSDACALQGDRVDQAGDPAVDVLFVVDFHESMADERAALGAAMSYLLAELRDADGALADLHIGFVSPDLGAGGQGVAGCVEPTAGQAGLLDAGGCTGMGGANYLVDVAPRGCTVTRDPTFGRCTAHDCLAEHCDHEPQANLVEDEHDCPRCRNFGLLPDNLFDCAAGHPTTDCDFRQPLEAMRLALDNHPGNPDFLRDRAHLAVVVVSNTDDCSADGPELFDPSTAGLGPLTTFRCFEHGVTCNEGGRDPGPRTGCAPVTNPGADPGTPLHSLTRYTDFLSNLRHGAQLTVAALSGPIEADGATVTTDASGLPALDSSCAPTMEHATPGFRLRAWSAHYNDVESTFWPFSPLCGELGAALRGVGENVATALAHPCPAAPLAGCSDPGALTDEGWDDETCNDNCQPQCWVVEATADSLPTETRAWLPHCLGVCAEGLCLDNTDDAAAYMGGHPPLRDPDLPVAACWHVVGDPLCTAARGANIAIARRQDPPLRTFAYVDCVQLDVSEVDCADGRDDDGDCLIDLDDPDCGL